MELNVDASIYSNRIRTGICLFVRCLFLFRKTVEDIELKLWIEKSKELTKNIIQLNVEHHFGVYKLDAKEVFILND